MEKFIELEVLTTAFQIEMDESSFVIVWGIDLEGGGNTRCVYYWDYVNQELQDPFDNFQRADLWFKMTGWSKIPFLDH